MSWSTEFDDPIMLANGNVLFTLRDAANHVMALPKTESAQPHWLTAVHMPDGGGREARANDAGAHRNAEGAEPRTAGRAASAAQEGD